jgi:acyl-CoA thioester hydrolase
VYYEDTDAAGIVYYANYLKFAERARTEWLRALGFDHTRLLREEGIAFVVHRCSIEYRSAARLDDAISVETRLQEIGKVRMTMQQTMKRSETTLALLQLELAGINAQGKPARWPQRLLETLKHTTDNA